MNRAALAFAALAFLWGCTGPERREAQPQPTRGAMTALEDALILTAVRSAFFEAEPDQASGVAVSVRNGVVTLRGTVRDARSRTNLVQHAEETVHVNRVIDELRIDPHRRRFGARNAAGRIRVAGP